MIQNASAAAAAREAAISELREAAIQESEQRVQEAAQAARILRTRYLLEATDSASRESQQTGRLDQARYMLGLLFDPSHRHHRLSTISTWTDISERFVQDEKRQIRMQIEATSTAKLAPKLNETELIQSLVCSEQMKSVAFLTLAGPPIPTT
jgi:hypothetical protein